MTIEESCISMLYSLNLIPVSFSYDDINLWDFPSIQYVHNSMDSARLVRFGGSLHSLVTGPGTGLLLSRECLSHDRIYYRMSTRTFESML